MKAEIELKKQREKEREAARVALQKVKPFVCIAFQHIDSLGKGSLLLLFVFSLQMERTVEIEHNLEILKELEMLSGCCLSPHLLTGSEALRRAFKGAHFKNPLERIGLFMKSDYLVEDEDEETLNLNGDGEEGEIFS